MKRKYIRKKTVVNKSIDGKLPPDILQSIEITCEFRKALGLPDDKEKRIKRALRYQEFIGNK